MLTRTLVLFSLGLAAVLFGAAQSDAQPGKKGPKGFGKGPGAGPDVRKIESNIDRLMAELTEAKEQLARAKEASRGKKGGFDGFGKGKGKGKGDFKKKDFAKKEGFKKKEMAKPGFAPFGGKGKEGFGKGKEGFGKGWAKGWGKDWAKGGKGKEGVGKGWGKDWAKGGKGGFGPKGYEAKLSPEVIKERYEHYKKLYDESRRETAKGGRGKGKGKGGFGPKGFEGKKKEMGKGFPPFGGKGFGPMGGFGKKFEAKKEAPPARAGSGRGDSVEARIDRLTRELEALRSELRKKNR